MTFEIFDNVTSDVVGYAISAYSSIDPYFWPFVFIGLIGYVYTAMNSVIAAVVAILITFGTYVGTTSIFQDVPAISQLLYIISLVGIALLLFMLIMKGHKEAGQ